MPLDAKSVDELGDSYTFVVDSDGTCVLNPRAPEKLGTKPWDWCIADDVARCREEFVQACMMRHERAPFEVRVQYDHRILRLSMRLFPLETGQVLGLFHRLFDGKLTDRERHVLALLAGGATADEVASVLQITPSTARDHVSSIKRKLSIHTSEGYRLAAHHFGLMQNGHPE